MKAAYVDTSVLVAIAFDEPGSDEMRRRSRAMDVLLASNLLEAEYRSVCRREEVPFHGERLAGLRWVLPDRPLGPEMERILEAGHARGADLWHLSTALYVSPVSSDLAFLTLDESQRALAEAAGFRT